jgi:hypothetical protein
MTTKRKVENASVQVYIAESTTMALRFRNEDIIEQEVEL